MGIDIAVFLIVFIAMEWVAWALHKYVMHGFLWYLHEDHHVPNTQRWWQKNDFFAFFFAVPSFLCILFGTQLGAPSWVAAFGFGIMAYGAAYFFVHEVIIHRRLKWPVSQNWYIQSLIQAHRAHHKVATKHGCICFGMLVVPLKFYKKSLAKN